MIALGKIGGTTAEAALIDLLKDDELTGHVIWALGNLRSVKAEPYIEPFLGHSMAWIRKEASNARKKIVSRKQA